MRFLQIFLIFSCSVTAVVAQRITFADVTAASGIDVPHIATPENRYIIESMSGGAAVFDCDGDGFLDVITVNGSSVDRFRAGGDLFVSLYRQINGATSATPQFENVTATAGLKSRGWGMGVTAVDFDNDGITDIFVTGFRGNALYRGRGGCKFEDVTSASGLKGEGFMTGAAWADYDRDGDLDVMIAGYVTLDLDRLPVFGSSQTCSFKGIRVQCGPRGLPGERDYFFRNKGDGTFEEVSAAVGVGDKPKYYGLGVIWGDYDDDGWPDVYVANDGTPNYLYRNNRNGTFTDVGFETGTSYSGTGVEQGSMGVAWGDFDGDARPDLYVTNFDNESNALYRHVGPKGFLDVALEAKVGAPSLPFVGWGTGFVDFDNDGWLDIFVVNGHVYPQLELIQGGNQLGYRQHFLLHRNLGNGTFADETAASGLRNLPLLSRRGSAFGDLNNDGRTDVVVTNVGAVPTVLLNTSPAPAQSLIVTLVDSGTKQTAAVGGRVTVRTNRRTMVRSVEAGGSYLSQNDFRLQFGFPADEKMSGLEVRWADGMTERFQVSFSNKMIVVTRGKGVTETRDFREIKQKEKNND